MKSNIGRAIFLGVLGGVALTVVVFFLTACRLS